MVACALSAVVVSRLTIVDEDALVNKEDHHEKCYQNGGANHVEKCIASERGCHRCLHYWPTYHRLQIVVLDRIGSEFDALAIGVIDKR